MTGSEEQFKTGNICRIYIKNFLTLSEVEIRPKPKLNFICGPNGSGKSTVLCAVCLCLLGKTTTIGRGKQVYEFVKMGTEEATIEIEIYIEGQVNVVVSHVINKTHHKTLWKLQGRETTRKTLLSRLEELSIQMDNLCQFLPQDRVAEFAKMNHQELLVATEKAVGDMSLYQHHQTLCQSGQQYAKLLAKQKDLKEAMALSERKTARLKGVVENLDIKEKLLKELEELKTQRAWYLYDHKRKIHQEKKEECAKEENKLKALNARMEPAMALIKEKTHSYSEMRRLIKKKTDAISKGHERIQTMMQQVYSLTQNIKDERRDYRFLEEAEKQRQHELSDYRRQLEVLKNQLQNLPDVDECDIGRKMKGLTEEIYKTSQRMVKLQNRLSEVTAERQAHQTSKKALQKELSSLEDVMRQRLELLRSHNGDAYRATQWLQNNRDSFKGRVYPPICSLLNIKSQEYARFVENRIAMRDLIAFVCENKDDINKLKEEMDRQKIRVNVVYADPSALQKYKPRHSMKELRMYGFDTFILDCIEAPPAILAFLCQNYQIHTVPVGTGPTGNYEAVPDAISTFYLGSSRYARTKSRYDGHITTSIYPVGPTKLLQILHNKEKIVELQTNLKKVEIDIGEAEETMRGIKGEEEELSKGLENSRNEKRALSSRVEERKILTQRVKQKQDQIKRQEDMVVDLEAAEMKMIQAVKNTINSQMTVMVKISEGVVSSGGDVGECVRVEGKAKVLSLELAKLDSDAKEWKEAQEAMKRKVDNMKKDLERQKLEGRDALNSLMSMLGIHSIHQISEEIRQRFQNSSLEETEQLLVDKDAHLSCLVTASETELKQYKAGEKEMSRMKEEMQDVDRSLETHQQNIGKVKDSWLPHITTLVQNINERFSEFMSRMGYAGEVTLRENPEDFSSYGMIIRVKFRGSQKLQILTAQQQSGGERAVSTALYLLALQSLTTAPFRCVDEINQGMDKVNERKMLEMLMETEGSDECSQYFFVTPKLLLGMNYTAKVNMLCVYNSPTAVSHRRLTVKKAIRRMASEMKKKKGK